MKNDKGEDWERFWAMDRLTRLIKAGTDAKKDKDKKERIVMMECPACYYHKLYSPIITTQGFVTYKCKLCKKDASWSNGAPPRVCIACASENNLCLECGSTMWTMEEYKKKSIHNINY